MTKPAQPPAPEVTVDADTGKVEATPAAVERIKNQLPDDFATLPPDQQIATFIDKLNAVRDGAALKTTMINHATEQVAYRCRVDGMVDRWEIIGVDGHRSSSEESQLRTDLGWEMLYDPTA